MIARLRRVLKRNGAAGTAAIVADRVVRPFGWSPLSYTRWGATAPAAAVPTAEAQFEAIAGSNLWGSAESLSGAGSELSQTAPYRRELVALLRSRSVRSLFDAPCGDFNWMPLVLRRVELDYIGGDIAETVVALNRSRHPQHRFIRFDIRQDRFPSVEVWHCRDCLFHLSYGDIRLALENFARSDIEWALITTHRGLLRNVDIATGGWRYLNLRRAPFHFPEPQTLLRDYRLGDLPRYVGLWSRTQIARALDNDHWG